MQTRETQTNVRRLALFIRGDFFWLMGHEGKRLTVTVRKEHAQSPLLTEECLNEEHAKARFDHMLKFSRGHNWTLLYTGPRLDG